jgi:chorismate mutase/prephenate dehydratase
MEKSNYVEMRKDELKSHRDEIDLIDDQVLELLARRQGVAKQIGKVKEALGIEVIDLSREHEIIERLVSKGLENLSSDSIREIYSEIFSIARAVQRKEHVSYLGPVASFCHQAARRFYGHKAIFQPFYTIEDVFKSVENSDLGFGVVPIENSCEGSVRNTLDLFLKYDLKICAEIFIRIRHHLLSKVDKISEIEKLYSHAMAFAQCSEWIKSNIPKVPVVEVESTAIAARIAADRPSAAAIGSLEAGLVNGLNRLAKNIEDNPGNTTRFIVIGKTETKSTQKDKTSLLFLLSHKPGALYNTLKPFSERNINVLKIESRPAGTRKWEYLFFLDIEGHASDSNIEKAIEEMAEYTVLTRMLGSYPDGGRLLGRVI